MSIAAVILTGLCAFAAAYFALGSTRDARVRRRLTPHMPSDSHDEHQHRDTRAFLEDALERTETRFEKRGLWMRVDRLRRRAGLSRRTAEVVWAIAGAAVVMPLALLVLGASPALALLALPGTIVFAVLLLQAKGRKRMRAFEDQLPEVLETLAAALKVGHSLQQSLQAVATETREPASGEFKTLLEELRLGRTIEEALGDLATRMSSADFQFIVTSITIQRQVGGSLSDLMKGVAETIRRRQRFIRKVNALTAMGRISARVLIGLPLGLAALLMVINPTYLRPLATTSTGRLLVVISLVMLVAGSLLLRRMVTVKGLH